MSELTSEIEAFFEEGYAEVEEAMNEAGQAGGDYNVENGDYNNITYNLRSSNEYEVIKDGIVPVRLEVKNTADYASDVEARGRMVASGGALVAEKLLKEWSE